MKKNRLYLIFNSETGIYEAPFQMKANCGIFLIDDFGRQKCRPQDLLNRWIVPLEKKVDYLALQTGKKLEVPFDVLIVFSTNLSPKDLVDDAFLRRIRHKIEVGNPSPDEFREIFKIVCRVKQIPYSDDGLRYLIEHEYPKRKLEPRAVHPREHLARGHLAPAREALQPVHRPAAGGRVADVTREAPHLLQPPDVQG